MRKGTGPGNDTNQIRSHVAYIRATARLMKHTEHYIQNKLLFEQSQDKQNSVYTFLSSIQTSNVWDMIHLKENCKCVCSSYQQVLTFLNQRVKEVVGKWEMLCYAMNKYS